MSPGMNIDPKGLKAGGPINLGRWGCASSGAAACLFWNAGREIEDAAKECAKKTLKCAIISYVGATPEEVAVTIYEELAVARVEALLIQHGKRKVAEKLIPGVNAVMLTADTGVFIKCILE